MDAEDSPRTRFFCSCKDAPSATSLFADAFPDTFGRFFVEMNFAIEIISAPFVLT